MRHGLNFVLAYPLRFESHLYDQYFRIAEYVTEKIGQEPGIVSP